MSPMSFSLVQFIAVVKDLVQIGLSPLAGTRVSRSPETTLPIARFSLRSLFILITGFALAIFVIWHFLCLWKGNYEAVAWRASKTKGIYDVHLWGDNEEGTRNADMLIFRVDGQPDSYVEILSPTISDFDQSNSIRLRQIGRFQLSVNYGGTPGLRGLSADIGPESEIKAVLPMTVSNINELISNYAELEAGFSNWPVYPEVGKLDVSPGRTIEYYVNVLEDRDFNVPSGP